MTTSNQHLPVDWNAVADEFCLAWTSEDGRPDFDTLAHFYAPDDDVIIFDALPPLEGFRGFADLRASIYGGLSRILVTRTGEVMVRPLAGEAVMVTAFPLHFSYVFSNGRSFEIDGRISQVWERRGEAYVIVHEHPSTVFDG